MNSGYASSSHQKMAGFTGVLRTGEVESLPRYTWRDGGVTQNYGSTKNDFDIGTHALMLKSKWNLSDAQFLKLTVHYLTDGQVPDAVKLKK